MLHFTFLKKDRQGDRKELFTRAIETEGILASRYQVQLKVKKKKYLEVVKEVITTLPGKKWGPEHSYCPLGRRKANVWISPGDNS